MKTLVSGVAAYMGNRSHRRNTRLLYSFLLVLFALVTVYSLAFHWLMELEGRQYTWITGFYWTLTVMSTLGFGDITFESDIGRLFSVVVLLSGVIFLLILMPFTLIEFFYAPWMEKQSKGRIPRSVSDDLSDHVILTSYDAIAQALIEKLDRFSRPYVVICPNDEQVLRLMDQNVRVMQGDLSDASTFERARVQHAALVTVTGDDISNANTAFSVRSRCKDVPVASLASTKSAADVIRLAGGSVVFQLGEMMGDALARRVIGGGAASHVIGQFDKLLIAETAARGTELVDRTVMELQLPQSVGVNVVGVWDRTGFNIAKPDTRIDFNSVLMLSGTAEQLAAFDEKYTHPIAEGARVIVVGAGRVGLAVAQSLSQRDVDFRIIEMDAKALAPMGEKGIVGDAADFDILQQAGIIDAESLVITSRNDEMDIYLTIFCRKLRPDLQIISRATSPGGIDRLLRAGADIVMSYASMGYNQIFNYLQQSDTLMVAEGISAFRAKLPESELGKNLIELELRAKTGCNVIALTRAGEMQAEIDPRAPIDADTELLLIGDRESEERFYERFPVAAGAKSSRLKLS